MAYAPDEGTALGDGLGGIHENLKPFIAADDLLFVKQIKSAYGIMDTRSEIKFGEALQGQYKHIIFSGTSIQDCVQQPLNDAIRNNLGQKIIVPRDACGPSASITGGQTDYFAQIYVENGVKTTSTERLTRYLKDDQTLSHIPFNRHSIGQSVSNEDTKVSLEADQRSTPSQTATHSL